MKIVDRKVVGWAVVIFSLAFTSIFHIHRMLYDYGVWDCTIAQILMIQTIHLSNIGWDYSDGGEKGTKNPKVLKEIPDFLEFLGSCLIPSQCLGGPCTHFVDFHRYIYNEGEYSQNFSTLLPAIKRIFTGLVWLGIYVLSVAFFPFKNLYITKFSEKSYFMQV